MSYPGWPGQETRWPTLYRPRTTWASLPASRLGSSWMEDGYARAVCVA